MPFAASAATGEIGPRELLPAGIFLLLLVVRNQRTVPLAMLERAMRFKAVSAVEAAESLIYTVLLATLAYLHKGIWCYVVAMGCRDLFGSLAFNLIAHPPLRQFSWASLRPHVGFSLVYQGGSLLNMVTLAFPPIMIARLLGKNAVGYVSWASTLSLYPSGDLQCHGPHLPARIQQRRQRSRAASVPGGEILADQRQHCLAGLRGAGQPEHSHHRLRIHSQSGFPLSRCSTPIA